MSRTLDERYAFLRRWVSPDTLTKIENAVGITRYLQDQGKLDIPQQEVSQGGAVKLDVPSDSTASLIRHYGKPGSSNLTKIIFPYPMRLAWDLEKKATSSRCHKKVKESLQSILEHILKHYNGIDGVREARMDRFGGIYNFRKMRGGSSYSRHSWGIAIDLDPDQNGLRTRRPKATMPDPVIAIFAAHGWKSGGTAWGRDYMHFQATK